MNVTSAAGIISLLDEPKNELKSYALHKLYYLSDEFWPEISESIQKIEILYEDNTFHDKKLAALIASKVYYHLGSYNDSVHYALRADDLFDVNVRSEYVDTIIAKCIDLYIAGQCNRYEHTYAVIPPDERLVDVVDRMVKRCLQDGQYKQALGLGLEAKRMDIFNDAIVNSDDVSGMLAYALDVTLSTVESFRFRNSILFELIKLYKDLDIPDYVNMCQCFIFLEQSDSVAKILEALSKGTEENNLMAYQIAFDMYESAPQKFLWGVIDTLWASSPVPSGIKKPDTGDTTTSADCSNSGMVSAPTAPPNSSSINNSAGEIMKSTKSDSFEDDVKMEENKPESEKVEKTVDNLTDEERKQQDNIQRLIKILGGELSIELQLQFLIRSNKTDMLILKNTKDAIRVSICHTATVIANGFMHSGTTSDQFLRDNLEWLSRATNWAKLTATASLGVIHHGHEQEALGLMQSYLPRETGPTSGYSEGGGLYALGLIHANHGAAINDYLLNQLKDAQNEVVKHGGCLGLGLSAMGTHRADIYHQLKFNLYQDDAVTGEAAALGMGLVMFGSKSYITVHDMIVYAQETQHEKILRGLAVAMALVMYGSLESAESVIATLSQDKDQNLRRAGMFTLAMAFCGTGSNYAIRKLLHFAVSDVNDDVRRAAVISLGFILFRTPEQCPSVVSLLAESYNSHVRYGAAMALGIACAGTGNKEAISLLDTMTNDSVNFVRQGALIASAMVLIQQTEGLCPKVKDFRALYAKVIADKHEDVMSKFGAILAQGIIDAGGRNVTISLESRAGHVNMKAVAGMLLFVQYWYWFPLGHCLALSFTPTCIIALNTQLKMPKVEFRSNARPSLFGYTAPLEEKKRDEREKVTTAVLSIAARAKKRGGGGAIKLLQQQQQPAESQSPVVSTIATVTTTTTTSTTVATTSSTSTTVVTTSSTSSTATVETAIASGASNVPMSISELSVVTAPVEKMQVDENKEEETAQDKEKPVVKEKEKEKGKEKEKPKDKKKESDEKKSEPNFEILSNPARVMNQQLKYLQLTDETDYKPMKSITHGGIILFHCTKPSEEQIVEPVAAFGPKPEDEREVEPPAPFMYEE